MRMVSKLRSVVRSGGAATGAKHAGAAKNVLDDSLEGDGFLGDQRRNRQAARVLGLLIRLPASDDAVVDEGDEAGGHDDAGRRLAWILV